VAGLLPTAVTYQKGITQQIRQQSFSTGPYLCLSLITAATHTIAGQANRAQGLQQQGIGSVLLCLYDMPTIPLLYSLPKGK